MEMDELGTTFLMAAQSISGMAIPMFENGYGTS